MVHRSLSLYNELRPKADEVTFVESKEPLTEAIANEFWDAFRSRHTSPTGEFKNGSAELGKLDAELFSAHKARYYHIVRYNNITYSSKSSSITGDPLSADKLLQFTATCRTLEDRFPVGKYKTGLSIIDESCVFHDRQHREMACYTRHARTDQFTKACNEDLLQVMETCRAAHKDSKRHPKTMPPLDAWGGQEVLRHTRMLIMQGVYHLAWCWIGKIPTQGPTISADLLDPTMLRYWERGSFGGHFKFAIAQAAVGVRSWSKKKFHRCLAAVDRAAGSKHGTNANTYFKPIIQCPFNGTAVVCLKDTRDHVDKNNMPGMYGTTQPFGHYPPGEGTMTLVEFGVVLLYRPVDTLSADFCAITHYTLPLTRGFRYSFVHFLHKNIFEYRATEESVAKEDALRARYKKEKLERACKVAAARDARRGHARVEDGLKTAASAENVLRSELTLRRSTRTRSRTQA